MIFKKSSLWVPKQDAQKNSSVSWPIFCELLTCTFSPLVPTVGPQALAGKLANVIETGNDIAVLRGPLCEMLLLPHQPTLLALASSGTLTHQWSWDSASQTWLCHCIQASPLRKLPSCLKKIQQGWHGTFLWGPSGVSTRQFVREAGICG